MKKILLLAQALVCSYVAAEAQEWVNVHTHYDNVPWTFPMAAEQLRQFDFNDDATYLLGRVAKDDGSEMVVPFDAQHLDSISFGYTLADEEKGHGKYKVFTMSVTTEDETDIADRETWVNCYITIDGKGEYSSYSGSGRIRGRGNSSWLYYDKKPYKFKLDAKSKLLGLDKAKNWNLLSNYRDVTDMMNVFAFETARWMGMPHTNHTRFVEVFLNGDYVGVYQLTEKIEIGKNRVDIDETDGVLLSLDQDDGPSLSPGAGDNFWSEVYQLPLCVKEPKELTDEQRDAVKADFAALERAVQAHDYEKVSELMDVPSFIGILQLHEYLYNVEIDAPRSLYLYKDKDGKYTFGPVWDWDAAYCFDWNNWTVNHAYFGDYKRLIYGTNPVAGTGASYSINHFFRDMFADKTFVQEYKKAWAERSGEIYERNWAEVEKYVAEMRKGAYGRDIARWPLAVPGARNQYFDVETELKKMSEWLKNRKVYLDEVIAHYPETDEMPSGEPAMEVKDGKVIVTANVNFASGYSQPYSIKIDGSVIGRMLGGTPTSLQPLDADRSVGSNTAAGVYGAWFDEDGDTNSWGFGHVYIEADELYNWRFGCHPGNCQSGDEHTVRMRYGRGGKTIDVEVRFIVK